MSNPTIIIASYKPSSNSYCCGDNTNYDSNFCFTELSNGGLVDLMAEAADKISDLDSEKLDYEEEGYQHTIKVFGAFDEQISIAYIKELATKATEKKIAQKVEAQKREIEEAREKQRLESKNREEEVARKQFEVLKARFEPKVFQCDCGCSPDFACCTYKEPPESD